ncbi:ABC transporter permease subunit [Acidianus sp. HS-5]|uniref:ABC transporter permease subunit n=1 Tax=Acidianus sp. HS-5 TaxID=2886040 RepID=UPI001F3EAC3B|nr:ABC transporter permease subunit [Acidianus sp. HS-5]BDC17917.1 hypothetical protein HS5_08070 [Acidianus sp. HS-5]
MNPVIYDFKRAFLRWSVVGVLILFIILGVAEGYTEYYSSLGKVPPSAHYNLNFVGVVSRGNGVVTVKGYVFNNQGNPLSGTVELLQGGRCISSTTSNSSGFFIIRGANPTCIIVKYSSYEEKGILSQGLQKFVIYNLSYFYNFKVTNCKSVAVIIGVNNYEGKLIFANVFCKGSLYMAFYPKHANASCIYYYVKGGHILPVFKGSICYQTINYSSPIMVKTISIPHGTEDIAVTELDSNGNLYSTILNYYPIPYLEYLISYCLSESVDKGLNSASLIFQAFFPIIMIYLAYILYTKPLDSGAIEFIISRPLTRTNFYLNRLISGLLTGVVSSLVFSLLLGVVFIPLVHFFPSFVVSLLILRIIPAVMFYYIMTFALSSFIKSSKVVLGASIGLYFVIGIMLLLASIQHNYTLLYYANPTAISEVATYIMFRLTLANAPFNVLFSIISQIAWLVVPSLLSYLKFKGMDL